MAPGDWRPQPTATSNRDFRLGLYGSARRTKDADRRPDAVSPPPGDFILKVEKSPGRGYNTDVTYPCLTKGYLTVPIVRPTLLKMAFQAQELPIS